jgi:diguanylate cyclase (GGDEF)-like protein/PAS domain S-box-containing protein
MLQVVISNRSLSDCSAEAVIFQRKWNTAVTRERPLPPFEEIVLGSLGRLAQNLLVLEKLPTAGFKVIRCGRGLWDWVGNDAEQKSLDELAPDFAAPLKMVLDRAIESGAPALQHARRVRGGMMGTFEFLALPLSCRWNKTLVAAHVMQVGTPLNLVDTIFRSTEQGILALAAVRDGSGTPVDFQIVAFNSGAAPLLGGSESERRWSTLSSLKSTLDTPKMRRFLLAALESGQHQQFELSIARDDSQVHLSVGVAAVGDLVSTTLTDITEIRNREDSFRLLFEANPVPMWLYDPDTLRIESVNDAALAHYGYSHDRFVSMTLPDMWPGDEREQHRLVALAVGNNYFSGRSWRHLKNDGTEIEVLTYARRVAFAGRQSILVAVVDVTERKRAEARIEYLAHHDALTELPNRVLFHQRLEEALAHVRRTKGLLAVHCIDLDHFKGVNDTLGHPIGDCLLRAAAERLTQAACGTSLVARLGGDEFAVIQTDVEHPGDANDLAIKMIAAVSSRYEVEGHEVVVGASIGMALAPSDGDTPAALLRNADLALYRAKGDGRGVAHFFEPEMDRRVQARRLLELDMRKALVNGEFELHYQPLINLHNDQINGFEALLRWRHPTRGMVSPGDFIPLAEEIGMIGPLGEWVLREACNEAARWPNEIKVAVNLSPVQFRSQGVVQAVMTALAYSRLAPDRLELEITESVLLADTEANLAILHKFRDLGVRISMDDFGTGYSSLSYLRSFPFDKIKIDRSFVHDLANRPDCLAIVHAVIGLGARLGISTTAEGVETQEELDRLRAEGCSEAQGFLFSRPRPAIELAELLSSVNRRAEVA